MVEATQRAPIRHKAPIERLPESCACAACTFGRGRRTANRASAGVPRAAYRGDGASPGGRRPARIPQARENCAAARWGLVALCPGEVQRIGLSVGVANRAGDRVPVILDGGGVGKHHRLGSRPFRKAMTRSRSTSRTGDDTFDLPDGPIPARLPRKGQEGVAGRFLGKVTGLSPARHQRKRTAASATTAGNPPGSHAATFPQVAEGAMLRLHPPATLLVTQQLDLATQCLHRLHHLQDILSLAGGGSREGLRNQGLLLQVADQGWH